MANHTMRHVSSFVARSNWNCFGLGAYSGSAGEVQKLVRRADGKRIVFIVNNSTSPTTTPNASRKLRVVVKLDGHTPTSDSKRK